MLISRKEVLLTSAHEALPIVFVMGAVILFCRAFPFLFFRGKNINGRNAETNADSPRKAAFLKFVEKTVPPVAMTVLAFNALGGAFVRNIEGGILVLAASVFTALVHIWKNNPLASIFGGTAVYMILQQIMA